jgi:hypothetical protein
VPDELPSVVITEPRHTVERSPAANVQISVQATDDLGLDGLKRVAEKFDAKPGDRPLFEQPLTWSDRTVDPASGNTTGRADFPWNLSSLNLQPGTRLIFYAMVQDNYDVAGKRHPWMKSSSLNLQIRSEAEIADVARKHLNEVKERIKAIKTQQEQTQAKTDILQKAAAASGTTTQQQKNQLGDLAQQENEQAASASAIQQSVEEIRNDLQQNNLSQSDLGKLAANVSNGMQDVAKNNMPTAASELNKAHEAAAASEKPADQASQAKQTAEATASASAQQSEAITKMDRMIDQLGAAGDFEAIRSELAKIQAKQDALNDQTRALATQTIGQKPEDLPQNLRDRLNDAADQQKALAAQTNDLLAKMDKSAGQLQQSDPAASASLQNAAQAGRDEQVNPSQSAAGLSMANNQMRDAGSNQAQAQQGLQKMTDELNKNDERQLEQLARDLQELIDQVTQLRDGEVTLHKDSVTAGAQSAAAAMSKLGDRQGQLQMNTIVVQKKAETTKGAQAAATDIHEASDHMSESAAALYGVHQPAALDPETRAVASLNAALQKLQQQKSKVDEQVKDKDLAYFILKYEGIQADQKQVKNGTDAIEARRQTSIDKQVDRLGLGQLIQLSNAQKALTDRINALSAEDKLKDFPVVLWMNAQIVESMNFSADHLRKAQTGALLASAQQNSLDRMQDIIDALKEEKQKNSDFKNDQDGGGGGSGKKPPLVPPLAQLKLLRAMQVVINGQTTSVDKSIVAAPDDGTKAELQNEATALGKKQGEIKGIATKMIKDLQK